MVLHCKHGERHGTSVALDELDRSPRKSVMQDCFFASFLGVTINDGVQCSGEVDRQDSHRFTPQCL